MITQPKILRTLISLAGITLLFITYAGYNHINQLVSASRLVDRSNEVRLQLEKTYGKIREADSELHAFIITGDSTLYKQFRNTQHDMRKNLSVLYSLMKENPQQCYELQQLESLINERQAVMARSLRINDRNEAAFKSHAYEIGEYATLINTRIHSLQDEEQAVLAKREIIKNKRQSFMPLVIFMMAVFSLAIMLYAYYKINKELAMRTWIQNELEAKNLALSNTNRELEHFVFGSSHDLQEPLRKIETFCSLIDHKKLVDNNPEGIRLLNSIQTSAGRMRELVNNLLGYARFYSSSDKMILVSLNDVIADVLHDYEPFIEEKRAIINVNSLPSVKGIRAQLYRLFQNLISNALKYSDSGKPPVITINGAGITTAIRDANLPKSFQGDYIKISIEDNGIGFDQEYTDKIFMVFQRLHDKQHYEGTGIGLAICKRIVQNHGGYICATSTKGRGSVFSVYFPAEAMEPTPALEHKPVSKL